MRPDRKPARAHPRAKSNFITAGITLGSQPSAALATIVAAFGLIGAAALVRGGAVGRLRAKLSGGDRLTAVTRFAVATAIIALAAGVVLVLTGLAFASIKFFRLGV